MKLHKNSIFLGFKNILPIMPSVIIFGFILGITGAKGELSLLLTSSTSFIIFAGSAQFIVILLIANSEPIFGIIVAGIIINLRHLLYGAVLNPYIKANGIKKVIMAYLLTDEAFLITNLTQNQEQEKINSKEYNVDDILIGSGFTLWTMWNISTIIGYLSFSFIKDYLTFSSEFIVASTFLGYFVMHWLNSKSPERFFVVLISLSSLILALMVQSSLLIILLLTIGISISMIQKQVELKKATRNEEVI